MRSTDSRYRKVSVLIPTRGRVGRLRTLLDSYGETVRSATVQRDQSELVFRVDDDDRETLEFLSDKGHTVTSGPRMRGYASLPAFFNQMARSSTGDVLMLGNDDMVFRTRQWPTHVLEVANRFPDGLFAFGFRTHNAENYPFVTVSCKAVDALGFIWDQRVFWGDIFWRDVMQAFGRTVMLDYVEIEHDWAGNCPDAVFLEGNGLRFLPRGADYWEGVHLTAVSEAVGKLRRLLS